MKKTIVILIIGIVSLSSCRRDAIKNENTYDNRLRYEYYTVHHIEKPKIYRRFKIAEFIPKGNPNYVCIITVDDYGHGISCIPKGK